MAARPWFAVLAVPALLLTLAGCGDEETPREDPGPAESGELTAAGTDLRLGETATVPRTDGRGVLAVTVTSITEGDPQDLRAAGYDAAEGEVPYYVSYRLRLVSGAGEGIAARDYLSAWAGDVQVGDLTLPRPYPPCRERSLPLQPTAGDEVESCKVYVIEPGGEPVDELRFDNRDGYRAETDGQIVWR